MKKDIIKFVGLHGHSSAGSPFDGLGLPEKHMDFAYKNGSDALALTDHGNMNGLSYQVLKTKKMWKAGKDFKPIFGIEAYAHPSYEEWLEAKAKNDEEIAKNKNKKKKEEASFVLEDESVSKSKGSVLRHRRHIVLLAQNQKGLNELYELTSKSYSDKNYYYKPRMFYNDLKSAKNVIASSACLGGIFAKDMWEHFDQGDDAIYQAMLETNQKMLDIFGNRWYGELQWNNIPEQHKLNQFVIRLHHDCNIPLISTADSHYPAPDLWKERELYKNLGWLNSKSEEVKLPTSIDELGYELYPKNGSQMWETYRVSSEKFGIKYDDDLIRESLERTYEIAHERIERFLPDNTVRLPDFVVPEGKDADLLLLQYGYEGLKEKGLETNKEYIERLKHEVKVIRDRSFSKYFLTMKAASDLARETRLTGPGRGSAAGALLSYALNITQVDPIKYGLQFERFMRRDDTSYPDIDYDVENPMEFKEELIEAWGGNVVVPISSFNGFKPKSLIKDVAKFHGIEFQEVNEVTSKIDQEAIPKLKKIHNITSGVYVPTFDEYVEHSPTLQSFMEKYDGLGDRLKLLAGEQRSCGRHAGGVVIGQDLDRHMPLIKSKNVIQTPWAEGQKLRHLEPLGFIKYDFLGLLTLEVFRTAIELILTNKGVKNPTIKDVRKFIEENIDPVTSNFDDQNVYENIFHQKRFAGTFQFTADFAQNACAATKPRSIIDLATLTAILRPGPMSIKTHKKYEEARKDPSKVYFICEEHKEVTEETMGFLVFQEQIAKLAHKLGENISLEEGNKLRKLLTKNTAGGVGKRIPSEEEKEFEKRFLKGCKKKGITDLAARDLWESLIKFSGYGFNASHAVAYSIISYQCAWLLHYYPGEFLAGYLTHIKDDKKEDAISEAKSFGFSIGDFNINTSGMYWTVSEDYTTLIPPLSSIKGMGEKAVIEIMKHRPFKSIEDILFESKIPGRALGKKQLDILIRVNAMDDYIDERFTGRKHFWSAVAVDKPKSLKRFLENIEAYKGEGEFTRGEEILNIQTLTGNYPVRMVCTPDVVDRLDKYALPSIGNWNPQEESTRSSSGLALCWFVPFQKVEKKTKNGKLYWVLKVADLSGVTTEIKCWGVRKNEKIALHRPYMGALDYNDKYGFSTRNINKIKVIG